MKKPFTVTAKLLLTGLLLLAGVAAQAQQYSSQKRITIYSTRLPDAKVRMNAFIQKRAERTQKKEETQERYSSEFVLNEQHLSALDSLANTLGWVQDNILNTQNFQQSIRKLRENMQDEEEQQQRLRELLRQQGLEPQQRQSLQSRLDNSEATVKRYRLELRNYEENDSLAFVTVNIYDEVSYPTGNRRVSFVNMPGLEYSYLFVENPKAGLSPGAYQGYLIKYMFTRGKSYLDLGVYKARDFSRSDSTLVNELFLINFGQDFYPKHFGRGSRQYLNLYTCYQVGGFIANRANDKHNVFVPNLNLGLGVELLKTRYVLIDNKVSYFLPLNEMNRNLRSIAYNASVNFVF